MELLERDGVMGVLAARLADAAGGEGRLVLLGGEAGAGKTSVAREFCAGLGPDGRVLWGACDPLVTPRALGPILDVAARTGGALEAVAVAGGRPHEVLRALVDEISADGPTVLVLEDLHWADEATLDLVTLLGRRAEECGGLVLATYREEEVGALEPLRAVLGALATARGVSRVWVPALSADAVVALAGGEGARERAERLHRLTGGNAFFVTEALAAEDGEEGERLPASVRDAVLARASRLSPEGRAALQAAAVAPAGCEVALLEALVGAGAPGLDECLERGMLVAGPAGAVRFRHEVARRAVEEALAPHRARDLHARALGALEGGAVGEVDPARLAHHAAAAGDDGALLRFATAAGERAARLGAHREAVDHYERAVALAEALPEAERADLLERASIESYHFTFDARAVELRAEAVALRHRLGQPLEEGAGRRWLSRFLWTTGRNPEAEAEGVRAVELLEALPEGPELAMALSNRSQLCMLSHDREGAVAWGERAIAMAERIGDDEVLCHALANVGTARYHRGEPEGLALLERSLAVARAGDYEEHIGRFYTNVASSGVVRRDHRQARVAVDEGLAFADARGLRGWSRYLSAWRAQLALQQGRWDEALAIAEDVRADPAVRSVDRVVVLDVIGRVRARRGDPGAWAALDEGWAAARAIGELQRTAPLACARAEAHLLDAEPAAAVAAVAPVWSLAVERGGDWTLGELTYWRWAAGDAPDVGDIAEPFRLEMDGDPAAAAVAWRALGCPYEAGRALAGSPDPSHQAAAADLLRPLGDGVLLRRIEARLLAPGARPPRPARPGGLTGREVQVLALLSTGASNRDVAERLVISEPTAARHVANIFAKLGVHSRAAAAAEAVRLGIDVPG